MNNLLFGFDTETTGLPDWKTPSGGDNQPHIVQLAAILVNADTRKVIQSMNVIIKPDGWDISDEMTEVHGITHEQALDVGIPEPRAVAMLLDICGSAKRVAHNRTFDQRIIRIALKRYEFPECDIEKWAAKDDFECTMLLSKPIMKLPQIGRGGIKNPRLEEAYEHFTGKPLVDAHTALADTNACMDIYWAIQALQSV